MIKGGIVWCLQVDSVHSKKKPVAHLFKAAAKVAGGTLLLPPAFFSLNNMLMGIIADNPHAILFGALRMGTVVGSAAYDFLHDRRPKTSYILDVGFYTANSTNYFLDQNFLMGGLFAIWGVSTGVLQGYREHLANKKELTEPKREVIELGRDLVMTAGEFGYVWGFVNPEHQKFFWGLMGVSSARAALGLSLVRRCLPVLEKAWVCLKPPQEIEGLRDFAKKHLLIPPRLLACIYAGAACAPKSDLAALSSVAVAWACAVLPFTTREFIPDLKQGAKASLERHAGFVGAVLLVQHLQREPQMESCETPRPLIREFKGSVPKPLG